MDRRPLMRKIMITASECTLLLLLLLLSYTSDRLDGIRSIRIKYDAMVRICAWYLTTKKKQRPKHIQIQIQIQMMKKAGRKCFILYSIDREIADIVHHDKIERDTCIAYGWRL